jgi:hypothetical protein
MTAGVATRAAGVMGISGVAQIFNLPYRRIAFGKAWASSTGLGIFYALRIANPRYGAERQSRNQKGVNHGWTRMDTDKKETNWHLEVGNGHSVW